IAWCLAVPYSQARGLRGAAAAHSTTAARERVLQGFLGDVEVAHCANQGREQPAPFFTVQLLDHESNVMIGLTSIDPKRAPGILPATWMASSRSFASIR